MESGMWFNDEYCKSEVMGWKWDGDGYEPMMVQHGEDILAFSCVSDSPSGGKLCCSKSQGWQYDGDI